MVGKKNCLLLEDMGVVIGAAVETLNISCTATSTILYVLKLILLLYSSSYLF